MTETFTCACCLGLKDVLKITIEPLIWLLKLDISEQHAIMFACNHGQIDDVKLFLFFCGTMR